MKFRTSLLERLQAKDYRPVNEAALARQLGLDKKQRRAFAHEVRLLLSQGELTQIGGDRISLAGQPRSNGEVTGKLIFRTGGSALVIVDRGDDDSLPEVVQIAAEDAANGFHGDKVRVQIDRRPNQRRNARNPRANEPRGRITEIVERARDTVVGTLRTLRKRYYVSPDDPRFVHDINVEDPAAGKISPPPEVGDKVVVRLHEWTNQNRLPDGRVIERLGRTWEPRAELLGVYRKFGLEPAFPGEVLAEVARIPD